MKLLEPRETEAARPYWDATRREELVLPWCTDCESYFWYPRATCPTCLSDAVDWRPAAGTGEVYAVSVMHKAGPGRDAGEGPYAVALVDLPEGVRVLTNVVGCAPEEVTVGQAVRLRWHELSDGRRLPMFTPA
jgi:uncharacterized OB-fold protein